MGFGAWIAGVWLNFTRNKNLTILKIYEICNIMGVYNGRSAQEETSSKIQDEIPGEKLGRVWKVTPRSRWHNRLGELGYCNCMEVCIEQKAMSSRGVFRSGHRDSAWVATFVPLTSSPNRGFLEINSETNGSGSAVSRSHHALKTKSICGSW